MTDQVMSSPSVAEPKPYSPPSERDDNDDKEGPGGLQRYLENATVASVVVASLGGGLTIAVQPGHAGAVPTRVGQYSGESVSTVRFVDHGENDYTAEAVSPYRLVTDEPIERWNLEHFLAWSPSPDAEAELTASVEEVDRPPMEWDF